MCGRYTLTYRDLGQVADLIGALVAPARGRALPTSLQHRAHEPRRRRDAGRGAARARARCLGVHLSGRLVINARAETAAKRFAAAYARGRCVVPADGFYEWTGEGGQRRPIWFTRRTGPRS